MPGNNSLGLYNGNEISFLKNFTYNIWGCLKPVKKPTLIEHKSSLLGAGADQQLIGELGHNYNFKST